VDRRDRQHGIVDYISVDNSRQNAGIAVLVTFSATSAAVGPRGGSPIWPRLDTFGQVVTALCWYLVDSPTTLY
jgi:hypothetical protein